jgi:methylmalonyl-CoA/ethylmalonyl-CoA epimerase
MLKRIDHIGVIVDDLAKARVFLESLGLELERTEEVPERNVRLAFYFCGDGRIEIIEPTSAPARASRLGQGNQARIEHIGVEVDDVSLAMTAIMGLGVELTTDAPVPVGPNLNAWTRPETSTGIQFQLVERDAVEN